MGTVGISFGSPTSGAGFDVSSTVAQIVGNLKNVETPWNTQLTKLGNQDTAISSLGTILSSLSNDLSSLTDFEGTMATKTGSSSDTNVLTLTAADNTAIAGTHTVEVTSLATTSSGYLAPITNASAKLSGSITLQAGNGTLETFVIGAPQTPAAPNTIYTGTSVNTLAGLAKAINASGVGINASLLTDSTGSRLSLVSGTSGAKGNIVISANNIVAANSTLGYNGVASNPAAPAASQNSNGTLSPISNAADTLSGSIEIQVGNGSVVTVNVPAAGSGNDNLAGLMGAINGTNGIGVVASIQANSDGSSSLQLVSGTSGAAGNLTVASSVVDTSDSLGFSSTATGVDAQLTVDGVNLTSASNTAANLIPGVTFQLLAPSATGEQVQVVIGNDNTGVESTFNQMVNDYNSLISAMNTQEGNDTSGNPEPLFGSPTLSLLQQQLMGSINTQNPNGYLDSIKNSSDALTGSINISLAGGLPLSYSGTVGADADATTGTAATTSAGTTNPIMNAGDALSGSISIQVGTGTAQTVNMGDSSTPYTLAGLAQAIGKANLGANAVVVTNSDGSSSLSITSATSGSAGTLTIASSIVDTSTQTIQVPTTSGSNTLSGLAGAINSSHAGVTANVVTSITGSQLVLVSNTAGASGALTVTPSITDQTTSKALNYNDGGSDINSLTTLGISVNNDGSLKLDTTSLDSVLNSDYSSVVGFFQNVNSWGQTFSNVLANAGSNSPTGALSLASTSNSNIESTLNAEISKENSVISAQQVSLTAELNSANEIMQQLPSELDGVNELYSAITGYNQSTNG
jgi:flagellar hook-associated protein 2